MQPAHFHALRSGVQTNAPPSKGRALARLERILRRRLKRSGLFDTVEVEHTPDPDRLLAGICQYRASLSADDVAAALERLWEDEVAYEFWEVHVTRVDDDFVEFQGATREKVDGPYVTLHLIAEKSPAPARRGSSR